LWLLTTNEIEDLRVSWRKVYIEYGTCHAFFKKEYSSVWWNLIALNQLHSFMCFTWLIFSYTYRSVRFQSCLNFIAICGSECGILYALLFCLQITSSVWKWLCEVVCRQLVRRQYAMFCQFVFELIMIRNQSLVRRPTWWFLTWWTLLMCIHVLHMMCIIDCVCTKQFQHFHLILLCFYVYLLWLCTSCTINIINNNHQCNSSLLNTSLLQTTVWNRKDFKYQ